MRPGRSTARPGPVLTHVLGTLIAAAGVAGLAVVLTDSGGPVGPRPGGVVAETSIREVVVPPPGQAEVSGTLTHLDGVDVVGPPLSLPVPLDPATIGGAVVEAALVDGERVTVVWDGGRPLTVRGDGGIDLGPTAVTVDAGGTVRWTLGPGPRALLAGTYSVDAPVAVGGQGLAEPRDGVRFQADGRTRLEVDGGVVETEVPLRLEGPGRVELSGRFEVRTAQGTSPATSITFGPGPLVIELDRRGAAVSIVATLNGPLRHS